MFRMTPARTAALIQLVADAIVRASVGADDPRDPLAYDRSDPVIRQAEREGLDALLRPAA